MNTNDGRKGQGKGEGFGEGEIVIGSIEGKST
jgi:hypothetical protein